MRPVFRISRRGNIAGCYMRDGSVSRSSLARVLRGRQERLYTTERGVRIARAQTAAAATYGEAAYKAKLG